MSRKNVRSYFWRVVSVYIFESSDLSETKNQCFHLNGKRFGPPIGFQNGPPQISGFDKKSLKHSNTRTR